MAEHKATQEVRKALAGLEVKGRLTPMEVVDAARDRGSVLHSYFTWDDAAAAQEHRIEQARQLIRGIQVVVMHDSKQIATVHYVRDPRADPAAQGYVSVSQLQREPENAQAMLVTELARVDACLQRAESLAKAFGIQRQVRTVRKRVATMRDAVEQRAAM